MKFRLALLVAFASLVVVSARVGHTQSVAILTRGPYLQSGTPTSIVIRWRTASATDSRVQYGPAPDALTSSLSDPAATTEHQVLLSGLAPHTRYCYSVGSSSQVLSGGDEAHCFVTAPPVGATSPVRIWTFGDAGFAQDAQRSVRDAYINFAGGQRTDVWLMLGDNAYYNGTDAEYQAGVFDIYPSLLKNTVLWSAFGNHDGASASSATQTGPYYDAFTFPTNGEAGGVPSGTEAYYSFNYANIHFISLNSHDVPRGSSDPMLTWLRQDLTANAQDWTVVMFHHPPYSKGTHDSDVAADSEGRMKEMRENVVPILDEFGVDLVLTGHSHSYERSFLVDGHYGTSDTLTDAMKKDRGDGRDTNDGAYYRPEDSVADDRAGAVYAVVGAAGEASASHAGLEHPVMVAGDRLLGSLVLDVSGLRLEGRYVDTRGAVRDNFVIDKTPVAKQQPITDDAEPDSPLPVELDNARKDLDGAYVVNWSYPALPAAQPCGFRIEESPILTQNFTDNSEELLSSGSNSKWQGDSPWISGPHPNTASTGYWIPYMDLADAVLAMKTPVTIPSDRAAVLSFASFEEIELGYDFGLVEVSANGGPFQMVAQLSGSFHGTRTINLSALAGQSVKIRFRLKSDETISFPAQLGWFVDDIKIRTGVFSGLSTVDDTTHQLDVTGRSGGTYAYRIAGLFGDCAGSPSADPYSRVRVINVTGNAATANPTASFTAEPNPATVGQPVFFNATASHDNDATGPSPEIVNYFWSFGDGNIQATTSPITFHAYAATGVYRVMLTVTDNDGELASEEMFVVVTAPTGPMDHSATGDGSFQFAGKKVSFGFSAQSSMQGQSGELEYHDRANKLKVDLSEISSLVVNGNRASFTGPCRLNKASGFSCTIDVVDNGESGTTDTFRLRINNGYDAGGTIEKGNIEVR